MQSLFRARAAMSNMFKSKADKIRSSHATGTSAHPAGAGPVRGSTGSKAKASSTAGAGAGGKVSTAPKQGYSSSDGGSFFSRHLGKVAAFATGSAAALVLQAQLKELEVSAANGTTPDGAGVGQEVPPAVLDPKDFIPARVWGSYPHTHDSKLVHLWVTPAGGEMPTASFVLTRAQIDGEEIVRPYTPIYADERNGMVLAVKEYPEGKMSKHLANLSSGDTVDVKGPLPKLQYERNMKKNIVMIAGGSGITPMYQVLSKIWSDPKDDTNVTLMYANKSPNDIMLGHLLETLFHYRPGSKVVNILDDAPADIAQFDDVHKGHITSDLIKKYTPDTSDDTMVLVCGPPGMVDAVSGPKTKDYKQGELTGMLKELGFQSKNVYKF